MCQIFLKSRDWVLVQYVNVLATKPDDLSSDPRACMVKEETYTPELSFGVFMHIDFFWGEVCFKFFPFKKE